MKIKELLDKCEIAYSSHDYKRLIELCDEIFKIDPDSQNAIGYKSVAYCFLNQPEKALEIEMTVCSFKPSVIFSIS